jgi:hypothetical protein
MRAGARLVLRPDFTTARYVAMAWVVDRAECSSEIFVNRSNDHDAIHQTHRHRACPWSRSTLAGADVAGPNMPPLNTSGEPASNPPPNAGGQQGQNAGEIAAMKPNDTSNFDRSKTLEELEGIKLTEPVVPMTPLVQKVHRLYSVPVEAFSTENLRLMIGQQCGLPYLVPIALEALDADPWVSGDLYRGDLLQSVLRVAPEFWIARPDLFDTLFDIFSELSHQKQLMETELRPAWVRIFRALYGGDPTF